VVNIFEQLTTAVVFHVAGRIIPIARAKLPELVQFISEDKPLTIAQTAGGIKVVFEVTPEFGSTPETAVFMEAEEVAGGSAKVASGAPAAESVQQKIAQVEPAKIEPVAAEVKPLEQGATKTKIKNSEQIVAEYDRYIKTMRLKLEKLEKYFDSALAGKKDPLFKKAKLKHLFGIDKTQKVRAGGTIDAKYSGFHHDKGWKLVKEGRVKFVTEPKVDPKTGAVKVGTLEIEGVPLKDKTFFPPEWSREKVIDKIIEASENIVETINDGSTCLELRGATTEGLEVILVIRKADKYLITAYPDLKGL
jgi:hypothetical protein